MTPEAPAPACAVPALHLGVILPNYGEALDPDGLVNAALAAEQSGLDSGWLVSLGFLAGRTHRLALGPDATASW